MRVLVDRNIIANGVRGQWATQETDLNWGGKHYTVKVAGTVGRPLPSASTKRALVAALPTVARLARDGSIALFTSHELFGEGVSVAGYQTFSAGSLFRGIEFQQAASPVHRSHFEVTADLKDSFDGERQGEWLRDTLLRLTPDKVEEVIDVLPRLPDFSRHALGNLDRFRDLTKGMSSNAMLRDAYHLWTAELNGLDFFLTGDAKFIRFMTQTSRVKLRCQLGTPTDLLVLLGVTRLDPPPLRPGAFRPVMDEWLKV